jgi:anti-sigma factor RsiW
VGLWRAQAEAIRARYGAVMREPVPARFNLDRLANGTRQPWRSFAAAVALALLAGGVGGWVAHGAAAAVPNAQDAFTRDALSAHRLYITGMRHPIEVRANEDHLLPWLSRRVGTSLQAPDLSTFDLKLLGGRLLPGPASPAAMMMYEGPNGERYTIYCARTAAPQATLRYTAIDDAGAVHWVETGVGYAVSGPANRERLLGIAEAAYDQIDRVRSRTDAPAPAQKQKQG